MAGSLSNRIRQETAMSPPSYQQLGIWVNAAAERVLRALGQEDHSFNIEVANLREWLDTVGEGGPGIPGKPRPWPPQILDLFFPQPGISDRSSQAKWPVQFLLLCAASSNRSSDLAESLGLTDQQVRAAAEYVKDARRFSPLQYAHYLAQALTLVEGEAESPVPKITSRLLRHGDVSVRLSTQETLFLQALLDRPGQPVTIEELRTQGLDPRRTKSRLMKKLKAKGVHLVIEAEDGAYVYHPSS